MSTDDLKGAFDRVVAAMATHSVESRKLIAGLNAELARIDAAYAARAKDATAALTG